MPSDKFSSTMNRHDLVWSNRMPLADVPKWTRRTRPADIPIGAGVYVWTITPPGCPEGEYLAYVGCATAKTTVWKRIIDHYINLVSGRYIIPKEFRESNDQWSIDWDDAEVRSVLSDSEKFVEIVRQGFRVAGASTISAAPLPASLVDAHAVERQLLWDLQPFETTSGTRTAPINSLQFLHRGPSWCTDPVRQKIRIRIQGGRDLTNIGLA
jgi:hypothetical protein